MPCVDSNFCRIACSVVWCVFNASADLIFSSVNCVFKVLICAVALFNFTCTSSIFDRTLFHLFHGLHVHFVLQIVRALRVHVHTLQLRDGFSPRIATNPSPYRAMTLWTSSPFALPARTPSAPLCEGGPPMMMIYDVMTRVVVFVFFFLSLSLSL